MEGAYQVIRPGVPQVSFYAVNSLRVGGSSCVWCLVVSGYGKPG